LECYFLNIIREYILCISIYEQAGPDFKKEIQLFKKILVKYSMMIPLETSQPGIFIGKLLPTLRQYHSDKNKPKKSSNNILDFDDFDEEDDIQRREQSIAKELESKFDIITQKLIELSYVRENSGYNAKLYKQQGTYSVYNPLLKQLIIDVINDNNLNLPKPQIPLDLRINYFKKPTKPNDNKNIILFVVGGITCEEIQEVRESLKSTEYWIYIGSTLLSTPTRRYSCWRSSESDSRSRRGIPKGTVFSSLPILWYRRYHRD